MTREQAREQIQEQFQEHLIFIDADKPSNPGYYAWALRLSCRSSLILADDSDTVSVGIS